MEFLIYLITEDGEIYLKTMEPEDTIDYKFVLSDKIKFKKDLAETYDQKRIEYPTVNKTLEEIKRILKISGIVFLTTPNNSYYKSIKLTFAELKSSISIFNDSKIYFYNTHIKISKNRKLNMANIIPKLKSKFINSDKIIQNLVKENTKNNYSVSFFVKAIKN